MANLVICLDGTWNNADSATPQSNVAILSDLVDLRQGGRSAQQLYYDPGLGTAGSFLERLAAGAAVGTLGDVGLLPTGRRRTRHALVIDLATTTP